MLVNRLVHVYVCQESRVYCTFMLVKEQHVYMFFKRAGFMFVRRTECMIVKRMQCMFSRVKISLPGVTVIVD